MMIILFLLLAATRAVGNEHMFEVAFDNETPDECRIILKAEKLPKLSSKQRSGFLTLMVRKEVAEYKNHKVLILRGQDADNPSWQAIIPDALLMDRPGRTLEKVAQELNGARAVWTINKFGYFYYTVYDKTSEKTKKWHTIRHINWHRIDRNGLQDLKKKWNI